jgi:hypothetical protein
MSIPRARADEGGRRAMSSIEVVTAMAVFGVTMMGLVATTITHIKLANSLEQRATVLVPPGGTLLVSSFELGSGQFALNYVPDEGTGTVVSHTADWANRLGVASLTTHDTRPDPSGQSGRFPFAVASPFVVQFDSIAETYSPSFTVSPSGALGDDGVTTSFTAVQSPL